MSCHRIKSAAVLVLAAVVASSLSDARAEPDVIVPRGARVRLEPVRTAWCLGDDVSVRLGVENTSGEPMSVDWGGDMAWPGRNLRLLVEVFDAEGRLLEEPWPWKGGPFGGPGGPCPVTISTPFVRVLSVPSYALLEEPGRYRIRVFHDLGWDVSSRRRLAGAGIEDRPADDDPRWVETHVDMLEPTPERIEQVLSALEESLDSAGRWSGTDGVAPKAEHLRHAAYVQPLLSRLRGASPDLRHAEAWLRGLASIPTTEASRALLELLMGPATPARPWPSSLIAQCAAALAERAPPIEGTPLRNGPGSPAAAHELALPPGGRAAAWSAELATPLRAWAQENIEHGDDWAAESKWVSARFAVRILAAVGTPEDLPYLRKALARLYDTLHRRPALLDERAVRDQLVGLTAALARLQRQGVPPPDEPRSAVQVTEALVWMHDHPDEALARYGDRVPAWLEDGLAVIRALTLCAVPRPLPDQVTTRLVTLLDDDARYVRYAALRSLEHESGERYRRAVLRALGRADESFDLWAAEVAAKAVGVDPVDQLLVHAACLTEERAYPEHWSRLARATKYRGAWPQRAPPAEERERLAAVWKAFLERNREALRQRGPFIATAAELADLAPR
ncbi:MAG: hypothetical protein R3F05_09750 [Planctomycetota bacterium]